MVALRRGRNQVPRGADRVYKRGQAALEALLLFLATIAMVSVLAIALSAEAAQARALAVSQKSLMGAESAAQAVSSSCASGMNMSTDFSKEGIIYAVENNHFHTWYGSDVIEIGGIFIYDRTEPI